MVGETVYRLRGNPGGTDDYGDPVTSTEGRTAFKTLAPVAFNRSVEAGGRGRTGTVTGITIYLPAGSDVRASDQWEVRGSRWDVDGEVADWRSAAGSPVGGVEVALRRAVG